ncbi:hypothetical protein EYF80_000469 [Liparis tanakae]|uniref:Uncharacterized protein n=1 Tax=Liparis tanakae TaxID=230148 RepID=A0A4Z2JGU0_9TELE|nr:hypothetical protein EYF80_000469 [Liparis tanakae]
MAACRTEHPAGQETGSDGDSSSERAFHSTTGVPPAAEVRYVRHVGSRRALASGPAAYGQAANHRPLSVWLSKPPEVQGLAIQSWSRGALHADEEELTFQNVH